MKYLLVGLFALISISVSSQTLHKYFQSNKIKVINKENDTIPNAFGGGLKFPVFSDIDLNHDGKTDIVILDRVDNRLLTFLNITSNSDSIKYKYVPDYENIFPDSLQSYIVLKDYNNDHTLDLFTFAGTMGGGIAIYKNLPRSKSGVDRDSFVLEIEELDTYNKGRKNKINLQLFRVDMPSIIDYDNDKDLDILSFGSVGGAYMYLYRNCCQDLYNHSNSFIYSTIDEYWGSFQETENSSEIKLHIKPDKTSGAFRDYDQKCSEYSEATPVYTYRGNGKRHAGSTVTTLDIDNDNDLDLLVGDYGYSKITFLENGKSDSNYTYDKIIKKHLGFPAYDKPIDIKYMPAVYMIDVNLDGIKDMIAAPVSMDIKDPFDNLNQVWLYYNKGTNKKPVFEFQKDNFLQNEMVDLGGGTTPAFIDYDADGDQDLFVVTQGNFVETLHEKDRIVLFENVGSKQNAVFKQIDDDYMNLSAKGYKSLTISFGDIDGDKDLDMVCGNKNGDFIFFKNKAGENNIVDFEFDTTMKNIVLSGFSTPYIVDLSGDSIGDIVSGERFSKLNYFRNLNTKDSTTFILQDDTFGRIRYSTYDNYTVPTVLDLDNNGYLDLVVTYEKFDRYNGYRPWAMLYYLDINKNLNDSFLHASFPIYSNNNKNERVTRPLGYILKPAFTNLDSDSIPDMILGSKRGGLMYFGTQPVKINSIKEEKHNPISYNVFPNPTNEILNIKADNPFNINAELFDITGKLIRKAVLFKGKGQIHMNSLASGIYILNLSVNNTNQSFRVIKY